MREFSKAGTLPDFAGFSTQTFDSLFSEMALNLPLTLAQDLMRYHWRMKWPEEKKQLRQMQLDPRSGKANELRERLLAPMFAEAVALHERLLARLGHYADRTTWSVFRNPSETCDKKLLETA